MTLGTIAARPVLDLSPRVISLAREIDRLPPGEYMIILRKPEVAACGWTAEIAKSPELIRVMELTKDGK
jgi:hypothetical protein